MVDLTPFQAFLDAVPKAVKEDAVRELFVILASRGFAEESFATDLALGAEFALSFSKEAESLGVV